MTPARFSAAEVRSALGLPDGLTTTRFTSVSTDTRSLEPGALFVALRGERFDGADFLPDAIRRGALGAVIASGRETPEGASLDLFRVEEPTTALGALATYHRRRSGARVMAITGSSGKTTVKEMLAHAIASEKSVHATQGNLNNRIGLPLSMLAAGERADVWVLELGSSEPGEIRSLTATAEPDDALVTTVGPAHLEGFGDVLGVLSEKLDLLRGSSSDGVAVVGELPRVLPDRAREIRADVITAGLGAGSDFRPENWSFDAREARFRHAGMQYAVPAGGEHHLRDALIAVASALAIGVSPAGAARGLADYRAIGMRGALRQVEGLTIVADCYNANPESFTAAIRYCAGTFPSRRLAAAVGTMLELGDHSDTAHREVATSLVEAGFALVAATGDFASAFRALSDSGTTEVLYPESVERAAAVLADRLRGDEVVLVKASRGQRLERVVDELDRIVGGSS